MRNLGSFGNRRLSTDLALLRSPITRSSDARVRPNQRTGHEAIEIYRGTDHWGAARAGERSEDRGPRTCAAGMGSASRRARALRSSAPSGGRWRRPPSLPCRLAAHRKTTGAEPAVTCAGRRSSRHGLRREPGKRSSPNPTR